MAFPQVVRFTLDVGRGRGGFFGIRNTRSPSQWARKIKKSMQKKKLVKSNKSILRKFFLAKFYFLPFQKWLKINFWAGKKFKTAKNAISRKKFWPNSIFCHFKNGQKSTFKLGKCWKLPKMPFHVKTFLNYLNSRVFFCLDFF